MHAWIVVVLIVAVSNAAVITPTSNVILPTMAVSGEAVGWNGVAFGVDNVTFTDPFYSNSTILTMGVSGNTAFSYSTSFIPPVYTWGAGLLYGNYIFAYFSPKTSQGLKVLDSAGNKLCDAAYPYPGNTTTLSVLVQDNNDGSVGFYYKTEPATLWTMVCTQTITNAEAIIGIYSFNQYITFNNFGISLGSCISNANLVATSLQCACRQGYYGSATDSCTICAAGQYSSYNAASCSTCPSGTISSAGSVECDYCPAGYSSAAGATSCTACQAGTFSEYTYSSCVACFPGTYSTNASSTSCSLCPPNTYAVAGSSACSACQSGTDNEQCQWPQIAAQGWSNPNWLMSGHDNHNTLYLNNTALFGCLQKQWISFANLDSKIYQIVSADNIYILVDTYLMALNYDNYAILWQVDFSSFSQGSSYQVKGKMVYDAGNSMIFVAMNNGVYMADMYVVCIDSTNGNYIWNTSFNIYPPITVAFGWQIVYNMPVSLYVFYWNNDYSLMQMIYASTGALMDSVTLPSSLPSLSISKRPPLTIIGNQTAILLPYVNASNVYLGALGLQNNYSFIWTSAAQFDYSQNGPLIVGNSLIFISSTSAGSQLAAISLLTGFPLWRQPSVTGQIAYQANLNVIVVLDSTGSIYTVDVISGKVLSTVTPPKISMNNPSIIAVDNYPSVFAMDPNNMYRIQIQTGEVIWQYEFNITNSDDLANIVTGPNGPIVPFTGGLYTFPCESQPKPKKQNVVEEVLSILMTVIGGVLTVISVYYGYFWKNLKEVNRKIESVKMVYDTATMVGTLILAIIVQVTISHHIATLVANMQDATSFKNSYLENCAPNNIYHYNITELCICTSKNVITPGTCSAPQCGIDPTPDCSDILASLCICDYSFYDYACQCAYNPDTSFLSCNINVSLSYPLKPKTYVTDAFVSCHAHYEKLSNVLLAAVIVHNVLALFVTIFAFIIHFADLKKIEKIGKVVGITNTVVSTVLVIMAASLASGYACQSVPNSGVSNSHAFDTTGSFLPGCKITADFNMEDQLLAAVSSFIVIIAMKPVQAFLKFVGLLVPHNPHGYTLLNQ